MNGSVKPGTTNPALGFPFPRTQPDTSRYVPIHLFLWLASVECPQIMMWALADASNTFNARTFSSNRNTTANTASAARASSSPYGVLAFQLLDFLCPKPGSIDRAVRRRRALRSFVYQQLRPLLAHG